MLHRDQEVLDAIQRVVEAHGLLSHDQAVLLVFHLGDLWDATFEFLSCVKELRQALESIEAAPKEANLKVGDLEGEFDHTRYHIRGALKETGKLRRMICKKFIPPEPEESEETGQE